MDIYAVRIKADKQLVCFSAVAPIFGEALLADYVDEFANVSECEYLRLDVFSIGWGGAVPPWATWHIGEGLSGDSCIPSISELMTEEHYQEDEADEETWTPFYTGYVYFVSAGNRIKIGYTNDVHSRLRRLQTGSSLPLKLLATRRGSLKDEQRLHEHYAEYSVLNEWFERGDRLDGDIHRLRRSQFNLLGDAADLSGET